jgi:hypothetical protein
LYSAYDNVRKEVVALKVEKPGKSKKVLRLEYQVLTNLQGTLLPYIEGLKHICPTYEFIESEEEELPNIIVMKMLGNITQTAIGKNLAMLKRQKGRKFTLSYAINLLVTLYYIS